MWLTCYSQWTQKGDKEVFKSLSYIISYTVKMLRLTVTSSLGTLGWGAGPFGEQAILQLWMEARLELTLFWYKPSCHFMWIKLFLILPVFFKDNFHNKSKKVCIKTRSTSASHSLVRQGTGYSYAWKRDWWGWPCFDTNLTYYGYYVNQVILMLNSIFQEQFP